MKRAVWIGVFVFSLALNLAVAATLGRHLWMQHSSVGAADTGGPALTAGDFERIRELCLKRNGAAMMETRNKILEKNFHLLDLISKNPEDTPAVQQAVNELIELKRNAEREAIARITNVMAALPPEKRQAFVAFLKNRSCMMPGMGFGRGGRGWSGGGMGPCPMRPPIGRESAR